jgi:hypothetical protein
MVLRWLGVWEKLSPAVRRYYLEAKSHAQSVSPEGYGAELPQALSLGLVEQISTGRVKPTKASTPFRSLLVQLAKWALFDGKPGREQLNEYLRKHYTSDEQQTLHGWNHPAWDSRRRPESFLEAKDVSAWERPLLSYYEIAGDRYSSGWGWGVPEKTPPKQTWLTTPETVEAARHLVRRALESRRPWPLKALAQDLPERLRPALDPALKACLRHALLFAALDKLSFELVVGVCPFILYMANRPVSVPPAAEACADAQGVPFHVEDMTQVLALAASDECLLNRTDYERQFFKSVETRLEQEFVPLPEWLAGRTEFFARLYAAADRLVQLGFVTDTCHNEAKRRLKATTVGRKWLAQSPADRLKEILFECQRLWKNEDWEDEDDSEESFFSDPDDEDALEDLADTDEPDFAASRSGFSPRKADLLRWQKSVWRQAPTEDCVLLGVFLDYHARVSAPGPVADGRARARRNQGDELAKEELHRAQLENFFWRVLVPFGCVEAAGHGPRDLRFRLSSAGQYLVGLKRNLQYGPERADAPVVVQPNFEIVFLGPDLGAEVALASFAERCGRNAGTLFRLTRSKMILAASRGATAERVLSTLAKYSSKPVPENVAEEVKTWFAACRSLEVRHSTLIQAGDEETALRIKQLLGSKCGQLSPTLLEWPEPVLPSKLVGKLREQGLFLAKGSPPTDA